MPATITTREAARGGGERQAHVSLDAFEAQHRARYAYAASLCLPTALVLDAACGVAYGSALIADETPAGVRVVAVDQSADALAWAAEHFWRSKVLHLQSDLCDLAVADWFDLVVAFEIVEHVADPLHLIAHLATMARPGGRLVFSSPHQGNKPFDAGRYPFHVAHYTPAQLGALISDARLRIVEWRHTRPGQTAVFDGADGPTMIAVAVKEGRS